ncbi:S8 family serine peptidase [Streptomyces angustmyceticus]|uniref:Type VII secretion-associated serine protease n=1 Tax=Streptomyces angustmyceticus TaxID=285578 RepID=A0A5J4LH74_9ACTN|nr:S8 family serine peptidase [Streptomyces angustmyceticus]UAL67501.1 S8 family serine peptidase [Streptomyces angustmyceticus]GES31251.1 type VII secretion-associated serine protease [Streptomyces angustmyceticus]
MRVPRTLRATVGAALTGALLLASGGTASADQVRKDLWPLEAFGAQQLWKDATGKGVTVAVLDSGFRTTHQDLKGQFLPGPDFGKATEAEGAKHLSGSEDIRDHGTAMAGIIAGHGHGPNGSEGVKGLAPDAKILPVPEYKNSGQATRWAVDHGADVINMSYGGDMEGDTCESIQYALQKGAVVVAAAGNDGWSRKSYPVGCKGAIGVGSVNEYGEASDDNNYNSDMDLLAPGVKVPVAMGKSDSDYRTSADGSSAATAYVSAAAALLKQKFPDLTPGQIANRLVKTAGLAQAEKDKNLKLPDTHYGYGFIQPGPALRRDIPAGPAQGPLPMPDAKDSTQNPAGQNFDPDPPMGGKQAIMLYGGIGLGVVLVAGIIIGVVVAVRRRNNPRNQAWG